MSERPVRPAVTLKIPADLHENLRQLIEGTSFKSVTELVVRVLRDVAESDPPKTPTSTADPDVDAVRARLRALGYID